MNVLDRLEGAEMGRRNQTQEGLREFAAGLMLGDRNGRVCHDPYIFVFNKCVDDGAILLRQQSLGEGLARDSHQIVMSERKS